MLYNDFISNVANLVKGDPSKYKYIIGVSGGMDSMFLAQLFSLTNWEIALAHMNFGLRGEDSNADQALVEAWADERGIKLFTQKVDTIIYSEQKSISTQMAARELRYEWFQKLCKENSYNYICTAHNQNDNVETLFLNIIRGSGAQGLCAIRDINDNIIRPILNIPREDIAEYIYNEAIPYRDDISNFESKYHRNRLRNIVFPEIKKINPSFLTTISRGIEYYKECFEILDDAFLEKEGKLFENSGEDLLINIPYLLKEKHLKYWLYKLIYEKGFNSAQIEEITECLKRCKSGTKFNSADYSLLFNRDQIIVYKKVETNITPIKIDSPGEYRFGDKMVHFNVYENSDSFNRINGRHYLDADKIVFPLNCRQWMASDRFTPFGMKNGSKKLSDFFIDKKISTKDKVNTPIILSQNKIACIIGFQIDNYFKITDSTSRVLEIYT